MTGSSDAEVDSVGLSILRALRRIIRRTADHSRQLGRESGLTIPQILCLRAIKELQAEQDVTGRHVAGYVQLSEATVSRILDRLEQLKLIVRQRGTSDRRCVCHSLSDLGQERLRTLPIPLHEQFLRRLEATDSVQRMALLQALEQIVELMDAADLDAAPLLTPEIDVSPPEAHSTPLLPRRIGSRGQRKASI